MDDSLRFPQNIEKQAVQEDTAHDSVVKDFLGIGCPMNFVKAKLALASITAGSKMEILLDDGRPIQNVSGSLEQEGHTILERNKIVNYWSVLIEKRQADIHEQRQMVNY